MRKESENMENQHEKIKGYRNLSQQEIDLMNEAKALAEKCGELVEKIKATTEAELQPDCRWLSIGATHLQQGFMAVVRSIAKPTTF